MLCNYRMRLCLADYSYEFRLIVLLSVKVFCEIRIKLCEISSNTNIVGESGESIDEFANKIYLAKSVNEIF